MNLSCRNDVLVHLSLTFADNLLSYKESSRLRLPETG